jgi:hypothetical protein
MKLGDHQRESRDLFGEDFTEVHLWLDEYMGTEKYGMRHRRIRHHLAGIREAERLFGLDGAKVARQHIISDLKEEGWTEGDPFPKDEADYVKIGFF